MSKAIEAVIITAAKAILLDFVIIANNETRFNYMLLFVILYSITPNAIHNSAEQVNSHPKPLLCKIINSY
jgi:hypothetical protein